jgi:hypothetical protein
VDAIARLPWHACKAARRARQDRLSDPLHQIWLKAKRQKLGTSGDVGAWFWRTATERRMTKFGTLGAAAVALSSALAGAAMAQPVIDNPAKCANFYPNANCLNEGPGNPYTGNYQRQGHSPNNGWRNSRNEYGRNYSGWNNYGYGGPRYSSGFWPADVAAGVVGGAVGTAGAIATAPFRGNAYAYNDRSDRRYSNSSDRGYQRGDKRAYAQRNGFVCEPGKRFKGEDGKQHMCQ